MPNLNEHRPPHAPPVPPDAPFSLQLGEGQIFTGLHRTEATTCCELAEMIADRLPSRDGMLVKRPLLVGDGFVLTGFREEEWNERLCRP